MGRKFYCDEMNREFETGGVATFGECDTWLDEEPEQADPFERALDELRAIESRKRSDYTDGSDRLLNYRRSAQVMGVPTWLAIVGRQQEKITRLGNLSRPGVEPKNESMRDSLLDSAVCAVLALIAYDEETMGV